MKTKAFFAIAGIVTAACATQSAVPASQSVVATRDVAGTCAPAFGSQVCSWAQMSGTKVIAVGATVPMAAIDNTPNDGPMVWPPVAEAVIPMVPEAKAATGIDHLTVYWEHHGHPPQPFLTPHFDFHFYTISNAERMKIDCANKAKPATLAAGYVLPDMDLPGIGLLTGVCVAGMGMHSLLGSDVAATTPFSGTMVLGYYDTKPIFFEPMVAKAKLEEKQSFTLPIVAPAGLAAGVHYPARFEAIYDASIPGYRFVFTGFSG